MTDIERDTPNWCERYGELIRQVVVEGEHSLPENDRVFMERIDAAIDFLGPEAMEISLGKTSLEDVPVPEAPDVSPSQPLGAVDDAAMSPFRLAAQTEERRSPLYDLLQGASREITVGQLVDLPEECRNLRDHVLIQIVESPQRQVKLIVPESLTLCLRLSGFPVHYTSRDEVPLLEPTALRAASVSFGEDDLRGRTLTIGTA